jgi:hypothetical protein
LDHALASSNLAQQVMGVIIWHINGAGPRVLDYNEECKSPGQVISLWSEDAYRSAARRGAPPDVDLHAYPGVRHRYEQASTVQVASLRLGMAAK